MEIHFTLEGLDDFEKDFRDAVHELQEDLDTTALVAARAGVEAVREDHPYADRTYQLTETARALPERLEGDGDTLGAVMLWPKGYAGYVDRLRPFADKAMEVADATLEHWSNVIVDKFANRIAGRG